MEENKEQTKLINRLYAKFHNSSIFRTIIGLTMATAIAIGTAGCDRDKFFPVDTNTSETTNSTISGETSEYSTGNSINNSENTTTQYSELLTNILTNDYYNNIISSARNGNTGLYNHGIFKPHPYAFLEDEGFDVDAIKNGNIDCYTMSYVLDEEPNNLYMYTRVTNNNVVHNYLLKYKLTDQEMDDYDLTHCDRGSLANYYIQSVFMNNEISKTRDPISIEESKMTIEAFEKMTESIEKIGIVETHNCYIILTNANQPKHTFDLKLIPHFHGDEKMTYTGTLVDLICGATVEIQDDIYIGPYKYNTSFMETSAEKYSTTFYFTQNASILSEHFCPSLNN